MASSEGVRNATDDNRPVNHVIRRARTAHPGQLGLIFRSKHKNDRNDAERLAKLLYLGETPTVHVPSLAPKTG